MAIDSASGLKIPKPLLVGLHLRQSIRHLGIAIALSATVGFIFKVFYVNPKRYKYEYFYKYYDSEAAFERMRKKGCFSSIPAEEPDNKKKK